MNKTDLLKTIENLDPRIHLALRKSLLIRAIGVSKTPRAGSIYQVKKLDDVLLLPFLNERGDLVIPADSPSEYHWWNDGKSILEILQELNAGQSTIDRYRNN